MNWQQQPFPNRTGKPQNMYTRKNQIRLKIDEKGGICVHTSTHPKRQRDSNKEKYPKFTSDAFISG
jgi:hypothetical protein